MDRLRIGIVGAGGIAGAFAKAAPDFKSAEVTAIASRDQQKANNFAASHGITRAYGSYEDLWADPIIDAVYIATPNSVHKDNVFAAARAGKHILCEKPLTLTTEDTRAMFKEAEKHGVHLIEGFPFRFQPQTQEVLKRLHAGDFGEVVTLSAGFGFNLTNPLNVRWDPELGGGALWDVGVYPINLVRAIMGQAPMRVTAAAQLTERGVDKTSSALLEYADGRSASIWCSFEAISVRRAQIIGTGACVEFSFANNVDSEAESAYFVKTSSDRSHDLEAILTKPGNGFAYEADAFAALIRGEAFNGTSKQETIENIATAVAIIRSFNEGSPVKINS